MNGFAAREKFERELMNGFISLESLTDFAELFMARKVMVIFILAKYNKVLYNKE
ncbi:MAG: hypothetical protein FWF94_01965 [Oscillospiraceae bacterium]|nr:hypothetical protein [Oscillospiraceae bacterium]